MCEDKMDEKVEHVQGQGGADPRVQYSLTRVCIGAHMTRDGVKNRIAMVVVWYGGYTILHHHQAAPPKLTDNETNDALLHEKAIDTLLRGSRIFFFYSLPNPRCGMWRLCVHAHNRDSRSSAGTSLCMEK